MRKTPDVVERLLQILTLVFFTSLFCVVLLQIITRFIPSVSFVWTEELARLLFVASVACCAPLAYKHGEFIAIEALLDSVSVRSARLMRLSIQAVLLVMFTLIFVYGLAFAKLGARQMSPTLGVPMALPYSSIAFSALFFVYYLAKDVLKALRAFHKRCVS